MWRFALRFSSLLLVISIFGCASRVAVGPGAPSGASAPVPTAAPPEAPTAARSEAPSALAQVAASAPQLDTLFATLWVGSAVEYRAVVRQTYTAARAALDALLEEALEDPSWTAALEPMGEKAPQRPAIILDVDETVLDNAPYQARLLREGRRDDEASWRRWCLEERAEPLPGALELTKYASSRGVAVFFITNRRADVQQATCNNLRNKGFPVAERCENIMTRGLRDDWNSADKGTRRSEVAKKYRIVQLYGDDLGDFFSSNRLPPEERAEAVAPYERWWGRRWIVLPNPIYGSWADALVGFDDELPETEALERRRRALPN